MKNFKKIPGILIGSVMILTLAACGSDSKVIEGTTASEVQTEVIGGAEGTTEIVLSDSAASGWTFVTEGVILTPDLDMNSIAEQLGEPQSYFEAASCAFEGLDKIYTYASFEIETYPQDTQDCIKSIVLKDDTVSTVEGIAIGDSEDKVRETYGTPTEESTGKLVYEKEQSDLVFVISNGIVVSIEYDSLVME